MTAAVGIAQSGVNNVSWRNRIINGGMNIIQRGTQTGVGGTSAYALDRWLLARENASMAARFTISSEALTSSDLPLTQDGLTNCQKIDVTTASGGISAGFSNYLAQRIEGFNIADVGYGTASAKPLTLSFWLKTDTKTGVMSVSLYSGAGRNYIQTISATTSWQKFTLTFPGDTGGSLLAADNTQQMQVMFVLSAGSDFYATANQWNAGFDNAASTQADFTDSTANNIYITGVQLERGTTATPFEYRDYGRELMMCQRYAFELNNTNVSNRFGFGMSNSALQCQIQIKHPVTMRTTPSLLVVNLASTQLSDTTAGFAATAIAAQGNVSGVDASCVSVSSSGLTVYRSYFLEGTAATNAKLIFSAEL